MRLAVFAEVDPNRVEGPAIWLASVAEALARQGHEITVLLRARRVQPEVLAPLDALAGVELIDPFALGWTREAERPQLSVARAAEFLAALDTSRCFDALVVRGSMAAAACGRVRAFRDRLAFYLTDFPQDERYFGWLARLRLRRTLGRAKLQLYQTPEIAEYLRRVLRLPHDRNSAALPPMVTDDAFTVGVAAPPQLGEVLKLVYVGKFAPAWNTLEMAGLPARLSTRGVVAELHVAGDKFLDRPDSAYPARMRNALAAPGVVWHGGLTRIEAVRLAAGAHVGLSWRAPELDGSLEVSTKLLEYGAVGLPVLCNPTAMHRRLLGADYPLFVSTEAEVLDALAQIGNRQVWQAAARATRALAEAHRLSSVGANLSAALGRVFA